MTPSKTQIQEYEKLIKKTKIPDDWEKLPEVASQIGLGEQILSNYLKRSGDVIEIDVTDKKRMVGALKKGLTSIAEKKKVTLLFRYSEDFKSLFVRRQ